MKIKVKSVFRDKHTKEIYKVGQEIEVSKERYNEIKNFVELIKSKKGQEQSCPFVLRSKKDEKQNCLYRN